ncbi:hypothetical protein MMC18_004407 [Xylographa bjoerkii]|nr:hypothetical protein [Xylographa bjoerkii]
MAPPPKMKLWLVYLQLSDGKLEVSVKKSEKGNAGRKREANGPTQAQLQKVKDSKGLFTFYQKLKVSHPKHIEWRRKLGGMLMRELGKKESQSKWFDEMPNHIYDFEVNLTTTDEGYILADFPEHFRLYEHCRVAKSDGAESSTGKARNSNNDRRDCYLYGHPAGRKKRYRSPAEFFPHLYWLCTDGSGDHENCGCKICCPDEMIDTANKIIEKKPPGPHVAGPSGGRPSEGGQGGSGSSGGAMGGAGPSGSGPSGNGNPGQSERKTLPNVSAARKPSNTSTSSKNPMVRVPSQTQPKVKIESQPTSPSQPSVNTEAPSISSTSPTSIPKPSEIPPVAQAPAAAPPALLSPTPLAAPRNFEQAVDAQCNKFLYRPGEIVWFNRGSAWGLAVITTRSLFKDQRHQDRPEYTVQPLSHPFAHPPALSIAQEEKLRPWLAWSAPDPTHQTLANKGLTYDLVDWRAVLQRLYGPGDAEVDGSIFAAKMIDSTYTPFERTSARTTVSDTQYNGVYCGGEKLWHGEAIRLRTGSGKDIMIVHHIVEKSSQTPKGAMSSEMFVIGDIYSFQTINYNPKQPMPGNSFLPVRVQEDLNYRNRITIAHKSQISFWKLVQSQARLGLGEVKGRWYESRVLLPILKGQADFAQSLSKGEIADVGTMLNGRGDATNSANKLGVKKNDRLEAFGASLPQGTSIGGRRAVITQPLKFPMDETILAPNMAMDIDQPPEQTVNDTDMSEFVDVNQMEESDYGQGYLGQLGNGGQF